MWRKSNHPPPLQTVQPITDKLLILLFLVKTVLVRKTEEKGFVGFGERSVSASLHNITENNPHLPFGHSLAGKSCTQPVQPRHQHLSQTCLAHYTSVLVWLLYLRCWEWEQAVMLQHTIISFQVCGNSLRLSLPCVNTRMHLTHKAAAEIINWPQSASNQLTSLGWMYSCWTGANPCSRFNVVLTKYV